MSKEDKELREQQYIEMMQAKIKEQRGKLELNKANIKERVKYCISGFITENKQETKQALLELIKELEN